MSASSSAIQRAISSAENTRGSGSAAPSARSREARKSINSCFSAGESEAAAASISASVTIRTSVHVSKAIRKAYVPRPRANEPNHFLSPACSFLRVSGCVGFCVALLRAPSFSSGKTEVCVILLGQLRHSCLEWHHEAGGGKPFCLSVFLEVTCTSSSQSVGGPRAGETYRRLKRFAEVCQGLTSRKRSHPGLLPLANLRCEGSRLLPAIYPQPAVCQPVASSRRLPTFPFVIWASVPSNARMANTWSLRRTAATAAAATFIVGSPDCGRTDHGPTGGQRHFAGIRLLTTRRQPEATPFGTAPASTEQCVVVGVGADPTPHEPVSEKSADSAMMDTDADRPEISPPPFLKCSEG
jgi:hypothetical protein